MPDLVAVCQCFVEQRAESQEAADGDDDHEDVADLIDWLASEAVEDWWVSAAHD